MGRDRLKKVIQYIHQDRPQKLKSYVKKYKLDLPLIVLEGGGNLLHLCSALSSSVILRYLLKEDVDPLKEDNFGNIPLHVLIRRAIADLERDGNSWSTVHTEMIIPMCKACPAALRRKDRAGKTAQDLLERFICQSEQRKEEEGFAGSFSRGKTSEEDRWKEKLMDECSNEYNMNGGAYEDDYLHTSGMSDQNSETYDEWADRLDREHRRKRQSWYTYTQRPVPPKPSTSKTPGPGDDTKSQQEAYRERLNKDREKMKRKFRGVEADEEFRQKALQSKRQRYEELYDDLSKSGETENADFGYDDIPWPDKGSVSMVMDVLLARSRKGDPTMFKKCLREQLVRWHPDKFEQKFGHRLKASDREKILTRVKEISQALNKVSEEGETKHSRTTT